MSHTSCLRHTGRFLLWTIAIVGLTTPTSKAQFIHELRDRSVPASTSTNYFFEWAGDLDVAGVELSLPDSWELEGLDMVRNGFERLAGALTPTPTSPHVYRFVLQKPVRDRVIIVVRARSASTSNSGNISLAPLFRTGAGSEPVADRAHTATRRVRVERPGRSSANRALVLDGRVESSVHFRGDRLPDLGTDKPFTVEF